MLCSCINNLPESHINQVKTEPIFLQVITSGLLLFRLSVEVLISFSCSVTISHVFFFHNQTKNETAFLTELITLIHSYVE